MDIESRVFGEPEEVASAVAKRRAARVAEREAFEASKAQAMAAARALGEVLAAGLRLAGHDAYVIDAAALARVSGTFGTNGLGLVIGRDGDRHAGLLLSFPRWEPFRTHCAPFAFALSLRVVTAEGGVARDLEILSSEAAFGASGSLEAACSWVVDRAASIAPPP